MRLEYFDMIDRVEAVEGQRLTASATVPMASPVFEGHFPGHPLVPGVLLTETMAQASGYLVLSLGAFARMPFLMGVDKARFRRFVEPGALLAITAEVEQEGSGYVATRAAIASGGKAICDASLRFRLMPFPEALAPLMRGRAARIGLPVPEGGVAAGVEPVFGA